MKSRSEGSACSSSHGSALAGPLTLSSLWPVAGSRRHASLIRFCCSSKMITNRNGRRVTGCFRSLPLVVPSRCTALRARTVLVWNGVWLTGLRWERSASVHGIRRDMQSESRVGVLSSKGRQIFTHFNLHSLHTILTPRKVGRSGRWFVLHAMAHWVGANRETYIFLRWNS